MIAGADRVAGCRRAMPNGLGTFHCAVPNRVDRPPKRSQPGRLLARCWRMRSQLDVTGSWQPSYRLQRRRQDRRFDRLRMRRS